MRNRLLLPLLICLGCERASKEQQPAPEPVPQVTVVDSMLPDEEPYQQANLDSIRIVMDSLENMLAKAPEAAQPDLLFELGRAKKRYMPSRNTPHEAYARAREDEFWYNEFAGDYLYTGKHFTQLIERFPHHRLADDAGYQLTMLPEGGECEGFLTCYVARELHSVDQFLTAFPQSPYAARALDRLVAAFDRNLRDLDLTRPTDSYDPRELPAIVARFDTATAKLPQPLRARADSLISSINARLAGKR
jgi:hypothetical protein